MICWRKCVPFQLSRLYTWRFLRSLSDAEAFRIHISPADKQELIEEVNTELSIYLGILYLLVEVLKDSEDFADDLSERSVLKLVDDTCSFSFT